MNAASTVYFLWSTTLPQITVAIIPVWPRLPASAPIKMSSDRASGAVIVVSGLWLADSLAV